jgi:SAM-dependent methyltransferase
LCAGDAQRLGFRDGVFSLVTALDVLEHLDDPVAALREMNRVCTPDGLVVISVPAYRFLWSGHDLALSHRRRYTARLLREQVEAAGLRVVRLTHAYAIFVVPVLLVRRLRSLMPGRRQNKADLGIVSGALNSLLIAYMRLEAAILRGTDLPFGTSLLCVARPRRSAEGGPQRTS